MAHTPAPWFAIHHTPGGVSIQTKEQGAGELITIITDHTNPDNVPLLTAAPVLLAACVAFVENFTDGFGACDACDTLNGEHEDWCLIPATKDAISKATNAPHL